MGRLDIYYVVKIKQNKKSYFLIDIPKKQKKGSCKLPFKLALMELYKSSVAIVLMFCVFEIFACYLNYYFVAVFFFFFDLSAFYFKRDP